MISYVADILNKETQPLETRRQSCALYYQGVNSKACSMAHVWFQLPFVFINSAFYNPDNCYYTIKKFQGIFSELPLWISVAK